MSDNNNQRYTRHIYFNKETFERLSRYVIKEYGEKRRAFSLTVDKAVVELLDKLGVK